MYAKYLTVLKVKLYAAEIRYSEICTFNVYRLSIFIYIHLSNDKVHFQCFNKDVKGECKS